MLEHLHRQWQLRVDGIRFLAPQLLAPARACPDVTPVIEALGYVMVLDLLGLWADRPADERRLLGDAGRRAVGVLREREVRLPGGADDWRAPIALADAALHLMAQARAARGLMAQADAARDFMAQADAARGFMAQADAARVTIADEPEAGDRARAIPKDALHVTAATLVRMLRGELDGIAAGLCATHVAHCRPCHDAAAVVVMTEPPGQWSSEGSTGWSSGWSSEPAPSPGRAFGPPVPPERHEPWRIAASAAAPMRAPGDGHPLAAHPDPAFDVIGFADDGHYRLAVYAADHLPVRVEHADITTEAMRPGYWIGAARVTLSGGARLSGVRVWVGERDALIDLVLPRSKR